MSAQLPITMKAYQYTSTTPTLEKNLHLNHRTPLPPAFRSLPPDTVLLRVLATSLNAIDFKAPEVPYVGRLITGSRPATPCMDFAGRVIATGPNTQKITPTDLKPGQLVFGRLDGPTKYGTLAEYTIAPRAGCVPIPEGVGVVDAAAAGSVALTAYQSIIPRILPGIGERVFLNGGSGGVGTFGIQIAKAAGCHVTVSCSSANVELCKSLGADTVIDYRTQDLVEELKKMPKFDVVVDLVGNDNALYWASPGFLKEGKEFVQVGAPVIGFGFVYESLCRTLWPRVLGGGQRTWVFLPLKSKVEDYVQIGRWMQEGRVRAVVDEVFEWGEKGPVRAFEKVRTGRARGKVVVRVADEGEE